MNLTKFLKHVIALTAAWVLCCAKLAAQDKIIFTWQAEGTKSVKIRATQDKAFTVNWGDGNTETKAGDSALNYLSHTYAAAGKYKVTIAASTVDCRFTRFDCSGYYDDKIDKYVNNQINRLILKDCSNLQSLLCSFNQLTSLNVRGSALQYLDCGQNQLTNLDVSSHKALTVLSCNNNRLTSLNLTGCLSLQKLDCLTNQLTKLDVSNCPHLQMLNCYYNQLTNLDVSECKDLDTLWCGSNQITNLDVSGCATLRELDCRYNQLTNIDVSSCKVLHYLQCSSNRLTNIDISKCSALQSLNCDMNQISILDVSGNPALLYLFCRYNQLRNINVSGCTTLQDLDCQHNQLTNIDVSSGKALQHLYCGYNQLTNINVSGCTALQDLDCQDNQLTNIDATGLAFGTLSCGDNKLELSILYTLQTSMFYKKSIYSKEFGTQNLSPQTASIGDTLFQKQSVFNGIFTKYIVTQNGNPAEESDYTVSQGKLKFNAAGNYTVTMTNDAIVSSPDYPTEVIAEIKVLH